MKWGFVQFWPSLALMNSAGINGVISTVLCCRMRTGWRSTLKRWWRRLRGIPGRWLAGWQMSCWVTSNNKTRVWARGEKHTDTWLHPNYFCRICAWEDSIVVAALSLISHYIMRYFYCINSPLMWRVLAILLGFSRLYCHPKVHNEVITMTLQATRSKVLICVEILVSFVIRSWTSHPVTRGYT